MVTTQWVMTEVADALAAPRNRRAFIELLNTLNSDKDVTIIPADSVSFHEGLKLYSTRHDKNWSLTDCISFVAMKREGINEALTGDHNFEQAGFTALLA